MRGKQRLELRRWIAARVIEMDPNDVPIADEFRRSVDRVGWNPIFHGKPARPAAFHAFQQIDDQFWRYVDVAHLILLAFRQFEPVSVDLALFGVRNRPITRRIALDVVSVDVWTPFDGFRGLECVV